MPESSDVQRKGGLSSLPLYNHNIRGLPSLNLLLHSIPAGDGGISHGASRSSQAMASYNSAAAGLQHCASRNDDIEPLMLPGNFESPISLSCCSSSSVIVERLVFERGILVVLTPAIRHFSEDHDIEGKRGGRGGCLWAAPAPVRRADRYGAGSC